MLSKDRTASAWKRNIRILQWCTPNPLTPLNATLPARPVRCRDSPAVSSYLALPTVPSRCSRAQVSVLFMTVSSLILQLRKWNSDPGCYSALLPRFQVLHPSPISKWCLLLNPGLWASIVSMRDPRPLLLSLCLSAWTSLWQRRPLLSVGMAGPMCLSRSPAHPASPRRQNHSLLEAGVSGLQKWRSDTSFWPSSPGNSKSSSPVVYLIFLSLSFFIFKIIVVCTSPKFLCGLNEIIHWEVHVLVLSR